MKIVFLLIWAVASHACLLDVTPDPYIPPPLVCDAGSTEDAGHENTLSKGRVR